MQLTSAARPRELESHDEGELAGDAGGSLAGRIRERRQRLQQDRTRVFALPGYEGVLEAEYRRIDVDEVERVLYDPDIASLNERYAQFLIDALEGIYGLEEDGTRTPLEHGRPLAWDAVARLADADPDSARAAVLAVFDGNDHELRDHGDDVYRWMKGAHAAAEQAIAGG